VDFIKLVVAVCADLLHIMGTSQHYRIINVPISRTTVVYSGTYHANYQNIHLPNL